MCKINFCCLSLWCFCYGSPSRLIQERRRGPKPALWILDRLTLSTGELWAMGSHLPNMLSAKVNPSTCVLNNSLLSPALGCLSSAACHPFLLYLYQQHIFWTWPPFISPPTTILIHALVTSHLTYCHCFLSRLPSSCTFQSILTLVILLVLRQIVSFIYVKSLNAFFTYFTVKVKVLTITSQTEHLSSVSTRTPSLTTLLLSHFFSVILAQLLFYQHTSNASASGLPHFLFSLPVTFFSSYLHGSSSLFSWPLFKPQCSSLITLLAAVMSWMVSPLPTSPKYGEALITRTSDSHLSWIQGHYRCSSLRWGHTEVGWTSA